ncbi:unnamed protein product [Amoebophrya sp. A120]|nr:unnamed protein product [Amoebophrya sp. A120]|eukprot:GSA120T00016774001.1
MPEGSGSPADVVATLLPSDVQTQNEAVARRKLLPKISRKDGISERRTEFAKSLFNQDLKELTEWHRWRSPLEQKKFLKSVDSLYSVWQKKAEQTLEPSSSSTAPMTNLVEAPLQNIPEDRTILPGEAGDLLSPSLAAKPKDAVDQLMTGDVAQSIALGAHITGDEPASGSRKGTTRGSRSLPSMGSAAQKSVASGVSQGAVSSTASASKLNPIDVHNEKRRRRYIRAPESLTLDAWLDANSQASTYSVSTDVSDYSRWTGISEMTETTEGSITSQPMPMFKTQYRHHRRGYAINRRKWRTMSNQVGHPVPHQDYPDSRRFRTTTKSQFPNPFGDKPNPLHKDEAMYASVFKPEVHGKVAEVLDEMPEDNMKDFLYMVRCLHQVRKETKPRTTTERFYDLEENQRLYEPPRAKPIGDPTDLRKSSVPLGTLTENINKYQVQLGGKPLITQEDYKRNMEMLDVENDPTALPSVPKSRINDLNNDGTAMSDVFSMGDHLDGAASDVF